MKKLFSVLMLIALLLTSSVSFASVGVRLNGVPMGSATDINFVCGTGTNGVVTSDGGIYNIGCSSSLAASGIANGGAVSQTSSTAALSTSYAYVRKVITSNSDALYTAGTLANGIPGQVLTVFVAGISPSGATTGGNYTITPTTSTGFTSVKLTAVKDFATMLYVDDTIGWVLVNYGGTITVTLKA